MMMTMRKSKKKPVIPVVSPSIPTVVEVSDDDVHNSLLRYGSSTPGQMATAAKVVSPMAVFQGDGRYFKEQASLDRSFEDDNESSVADRLGIKKPAYYRDDSSRQTSASSHRIGIARPSYEIPELPISPLDIYLEKKAASPTPNLVELDSTEDSADAVPAWLISRRIVKVPSTEGTEMMDFVKDDDSIERMVHNATAEGHYLVSSKPVSAPRDEIKYSLEKGLDDMPLKMKRASKSHMKRPPRPPIERLQSSPARLGLPDASFKVFLLLLNPVAKIFELIQVIYAPSITTLGDILAMIPANSTEPALGSQSYIGLCRPKDGIEMTDMQLMASGSHSKMSCARIMRGEILVAISSGYTGEQCAKFAIPILNNQHILKLLTRSDPLAASRKHKKRRSIRRSSTDTPRRSSRHSTPVRGETIKEEPEYESSPCSTQDVDQAMKHALEAAALANALLLDTPKKTVSRDNSFARSVEGSIESPADRWTTTNNFNHSANNSVSSGASYESLYVSGLNSKFSFQSTSKRLPRRSVTRRKHRRSKRVTYVWRVTILSVIFMVGRFMTDVNAPRDRDDFTKVLGWMGLFQFMVVFFAILKIHRYARGNHDAATKCPFVRASVNAAASVLERIPISQEKYA
jgi:hypothetical protein